jgi:hypothetical protein
MSNSKLAFATKPLQRPIVEIAYSLHAIPYSLTPAINSYSAARFFLTELSCRTAIADAGVYLTVVVALCVA